MILFGTAWNCRFSQPKPPNSHRAMASVHIASHSNLLQATTQSIVRSFIPGPNQSQTRRREMEFSSSELAGRGPLQLRRCGSGRRRRLSPPPCRLVLLLVLLAAAAGHSPAAASIFGGDAASVRMILPRHLISSISIVS